MSYEPTNWKSGDVVTSAKLNKLEQGVAGASGSGGGVMVVTENFDEATYTGILDKTAAEIADALTSGKAVFVKQLTGIKGASDEITMLPVFDYADMGNSGGQSIFCMKFDTAQSAFTFMEYIAESETGYPEFAYD